METPFTKMILLILLIKGKQSSKPIEDLVRNLKSWVLELFFVTNVVLLK